MDFRPPLRGCPPRRGIAGLQFAPERTCNMAGFAADFSLAGMRALRQNRKECEGVPAASESRQFLRRRV